MKSDSRKTILLVEDEALLAIAERSALERYGYEVVTAFSGEEAIETLRNGLGIDLVLMDINLGRGMKGTEAAQVMLGLRDLPLIFLSSHTEKDIVEQTEGITSYGYVVKSSSITVLDASIKMAFKLFNSLRNEREREAALAESERKYRHIHDNALEGIFSTTLAGDRMQGNPAMASMLGYESPEDLFRSITDVGKQVWFDPGERKTFVHIFESGENVLGYTARFRRKDGSVIWVSISSRALRDEGGSILGFQGFAQDVTERKQVQDELRERVVLYRQLFDVSPDGIVIIGLDGRITGANAAQTRMYRYASPEDLVGLPAIELVAPASRKLAAAVQARRLEGEEVPPVEYEVVRRDGTVFLGEVQAAILRDAAGEVSGYICVTRDITEARRMVEALQHSELRYRTLFDHAADGIALLSIDGKTLFVNDSFAKMHGYADPEAMAGLSLPNLDSPATSLLAAERLERLLRGESLAFEVEHFHRDGHLFPLSVKAKVVSMDGRRYFMGFHQDISERRQAELELRLSREKLEALTRTGSAAL